MNTAHTNLVNRFKDAGLTVELLKAPLRTGRGMDNIVQMDIDRKFSGTRRTEKFRLYPGQDGNVIQIRDVDSRTNQIVLMVKEPEVEFEEEIKITKFSTEKTIVDRLNAVRRPPKYFKRGNSIIVVQKTPGTVRYFLMGVDERQLFIAQLTGPATTCDQARRLLGKTVEFANGDRRKGSALDRQGEWFFLETNEETRRLIELNIRQNHTAILRKTNIGSLFNRNFGNSHVADEIVQINLISRTNTDNSRMHPSAPLMRPRIFVRGAVRHIDHKTVKFDHWREVIKNNEGQTSNATASGVFWVD